MNGLYRAGEGAALQEVLENLEADRQWNPSTVQTLLQRIVGKGFAKAQLVRGRLRYTPTIRRREAVRQRAARLVEQLTGEDPEEALQVLRELVDDQLRTLERESQVREGRRRSA